MGFYIASTRKDTGRNLVFEAIEKVRLSGPLGPLAKRILALEAAGPWDFSGNEIAASFRESTEGGEPLLLWKSAENADPCLVTRICGTSTEFSTELLVHLEILENKGTSWAPTGKLTSEALKLSGGCLTPASRWAWGAPAMSIGGAVIGKAS